MPVRAFRVCGTFLIAALAGCSAFGGVFSKDDPAPAGDVAAAGDGTADPPGIGVRGKASVSKTGDTVARLDLPVPPGTRAGDMIWAMVSVETANPGMIAVDAATPGTFDKKWALTKPASCANQSYTVLTRRVTASEPPYALTLSSPGQVTAVVASFYGVDERSPIDAERDSPDARQPPAPNTYTFQAQPSGVTTTSKDTLVLYFLADNSGGTWSTPTGLDIVVDTNVLALFTQRAPAPGAVPAPLFAAYDQCSGNTDGAAKVVALRPRP